MSLLSHYLKLPFISGHQAQKHVTHNDAISSLDALLFCSVTVSNIVAPPVNSKAGNRFLISEFPEGIFKTHPFEIASFTENAWRFFKPANGWHIFCEDTQTHKTFFDGVWIETQNGAENNLKVFQNLEGFGLGATPSQETPFIVKSQESLFDTENSHRLSVNKTQTSETASIIFQSGYSGRAEIGLTGADTLSFKVSEDGENWKDGPNIEADGSLKSTAFNTGNINIARDAIADLVLDRTHGIIIFMLEWGQFPQPTHSGIMAFDIASSPSLVSLALGPRATNQNTTKLTGTTGPDNNLNVAVANGKIIFENRIDTTSTVKYTILG